VNDHGTKLRCLASLLFVTLFIPGSTFGQPTPPGFERYLLVLMHSGAAERGDGESAARLQKEHLANLGKMWEEGLLLASGPIGDKGDLRGVLIFRSDRASVEQRLAADPLVSAGRLRVTVKPWMGPAGIGVEYKKWSAANPGVPDRMRTYQLVMMKPAPTAAPMTAAEQLAHLRNMDAMVKAGHLITAGPILEPGDVAAIFVFDTDPAHAEKLAASDPAVISGKMIAERHPWLVAEQVLPKGFKVPLP
jgi:uncharacterized protein YciI